MARPHRLVMTAIVIVGVACTQGNAALFASDGASDTSVPAAAGAEPAISIADDLTAATASHFTFNDAGLTANAPLGYLASRPLDTFASAPPAAFAGQIFRGRPLRSRNNDGSIAAMIIGSVAAITGTALLVYANRPECGIESRAGGCGYGAKVIGSSVLAGGVASLLVGALTWR